MECQGKVTQEDGKVWIEDAAQAFDDLIGHAGEHVVVAGDEVYIQPHTYLSFHLVQMWAAGWTGTDFDDRVVKACDNLFFLKERYGGWRQSNITQGPAYRRWAGKEA